MELLFGNESAVAQWAGAKLGCEFHPPFTALGIGDGERLRGAVIFNNYNGHNIEGTVVGEPACWTPPVVGGIFRYAFVQLGCARVTIRTRKRNATVRRLAPRLGFTFEGKQRRFFGDDDALVFGMLREECRFL